MTTMSNTLSSPRYLMSRRASFALWRWIVTGIAVALIGMTITVVGTWGRSGAPTDQAWPAAGAEEQTIQGTALPITLI